MKETEMTRERENQLISELQQIEARKSELIRQIVRASLAGASSDEALSEMKDLSNRKVELTRPRLLR